MKTITFKAKPKTSSDGVEYVSLPKKIESLHTTGLGTDLGRKCKLHNARRKGLIPDTYTKDGNSDHITVDSSSFLWVVTITL